MYLDIIVPLPTPDGPQTMSGRMIDGDDCVGSSDERGRVVALFDLLFPAT